MKKRIAIIACALGLPGEKGYSRFPYLANMLCEKGYDVDLYTSTFNHWEKAQRDVNAVKAIKKTVPYNIVLAYEPGYKKNVDIRRIISHKRLAKNILVLLSQALQKYVAVCKLQRAYAYSCCVGDNGGIPYCRYNRNFRAYADLLLFYRSYYPVRTCFVYSFCIQIYASCKKREAF